MLPEGLRSEFHERIKGEEDNKVNPEETRVIKT
jgi:hypothetical protein